MIIPDFEGIIACLIYTTIYLFNQTMAMLFSITKAALVTGSIVLTLVIVLVLLVIIARKRRRLNIAKIEKQIKTADYAHTVLQSQLEIQEQTLKKISQEIHENIGQILSLVKLNINTMNCDEPEVLQGKIDDSKVMITKAIQDLRDLSKTLDADYVIRMGLPKSIEYELELIKKSGGFNTQLLIEGNYYRLDPSQELILFRIVQEVFDNTIKHSKATSIMVYIQFEACKFLLKIKDNGIGFNVNSLADNDYSFDQKGIGNMHTRAKMINTNLSLYSSPGKGTTVELTLPIETFKSAFVC